MIKKTRANYLTSNIVLVIMFILLMLVLAAEGNNIIIFSYIGFSVFFILLQYDSFLKYRKLSYLVWVSSVLVVSFDLILDLGVGYLTAFNVFLSVFVSYFFIFNQASLRFFYFLFYITVFYICIYFFVFKSDVFIGSRNTVSVLLISLTVIIAFIKHKNLDRYPIIPIIITLLLSLASTGRSGIIASLLPIAVIIFSITQTKILHLKNIILALFILILLLIMHNEILQFITEGFSRLMRKSILSEDRFYIWMQYIDNITLRSFFTGVNLKNEIPELYDYNFNLHSFYFTLHRVFGFLSLIMIYFILAYLWKLFKNKDYIFASIILSLLVRLSTDSSFRGIAFFVFMLILYEGCNRIYIKIKHFKSRGNLNEVSEN